MDTVHKELLRITKLSKRRSSKPLFKQPKQKSIHEALKYILLLSQILGFMPVKGILDPDVKNLKYTKWSWRTMYAFFTLSGPSVLIALNLYSVAKFGVDMIQIDRLFFYMSAAFGSWVFLDIAKNWPKMMKEWCAAEKAMSNYGWTVGLENQIRLVSGGFLTLALIEHILAQANRVSFASQCGKTLEESLNLFLGKISFPRFFLVVPYHILLGLFLQLVNLQMTFTWTYIDLFSMIISISLAARLKQITNRIKRMTSNQISTEKCWCTIREDYNRISDLCSIINSTLSNLVLLSFVTNLFFILIQLFNSLGNMRDNIQRIYFYFSFGLLILRTVFVCIYGSHVYEESRKPLIYLSSVSPEIYNKEVERFIFQIGMYDVAISGRKFFIITKGLILNIAGAIVTYELVLIQFNGDSLHNSIQFAKCPTM